MVRYIQHLPVCVYLCICVIITTGNQSQTVLFLCYILLRQMLNQGELFSIFQCCINCREDRRGEERRGGCSAVRSNSMAQTWIRDPYSDTQLTSMILSHTESQALGNMHKSTVRSWQLLYNNVRTLTVMQVYHLRNITWCKSTSQISTTSVRYLWAE